LYIGTGNGAPWNRKIRSPGGGDNLFLCSVVALNPDTGDYLWHYQTTPGETWDFNSNMDIVLADLTIEDREVKAILHAPKNGFFYVIDRSNGKLISAEPFSETTWATHVDLDSGRPVEVPGARYESGSVRLSPTPYGAHSWHAMSYNPETGLAYYPASHLSVIYSDVGVNHETWKSSSFEGDTMGVGWTMVEDTDRQVASLQAFDPVQGKIAWEVPLSGRANGGTMTTAGNLVFQARASGEFVAYNATSGKTLWSYDLGQGTAAPPVTYSVKGRQYISLLVGWGGGNAGLGGENERQLGWSYGVHPRRLVTFSLEGQTELPPSPPPTVVEPVSMPEFGVDEALAAQGASEFGRCVVCHGPGAISAGMAPDLRASEVTGSSEAFEAVVREGGLMKNGMPRFAHLTDTQLLALRHFIRQQAEAAGDTQP